MQAQCGHLIVVVAVLLARHSFRLSGCLCRFFCRLILIRAILLQLRCIWRANRLFWL